MGQMKNRFKVRKIVNIFLFIAVFGSWLSMLFFGTGALVQTGIGSLRYFTVLSNLFAGFTAAAWLIRTRGGAEAGAGVERLKYIAAAAVGLTFVTVMVFLGPLYGYPAMLVGANLFMHLITPVTAIAEVIFLSDVEYTRRDNALVMISPLLYGSFYLGNIAINGIGEWPDTNDWYLFFTWGFPVGMVIFTVIFVVTWLLGFLMRKAKRTKRD